MDWVTSNIDIILTGIAVVGTLVGLVALAAAASPGLIIVGGVLLTVVTLLTIELGAAMVSEIMRFITS